MTHAGAAELADNTAVGSLRARGHVTHPRYFGLLNPGVRDSSIVAETLAAAFNPQLTAWSHRPIAKMRSSNVLSVLAGSLRSPQHATAVNFTSGGAKDRALYIPDWCS